MSRFGSDPRAFFSAVYGDVPPWDIGGVQPALADLFEAWPPRDPALDLGCGTGDLAIALARRGLTVQGIDFAPPAIELARQKLESLDPAISSKVTFTIADALRPSMLNRTFGSVVDSGFYHLFDEETCEGLAVDLASTIASGGRYYLLAFAVEFGGPNMPRRVGEDEVRARFSPGRGWHIRALGPAVFESRVAPPVPATVACIERT